MGSCQVLPTNITLGPCEQNQLHGCDPNSVTDILLLFQVRHSLSLRLTACPRPCLRSLSTHPCVIFDFLKLQCFIDVDDAFPKMNHGLSIALRDLRHKLAAPDNRHCPPGHIQETVSRKVRCCCRTFKAILTNDFQGKKLLTKLMCKAHSKP